MIKRQLLQKMQQFKPKATDEFVVRYQKRTLAPVEMAYLEQLKEEAKALSECNAKRRG